MSEPDRISNRGVVPVDGSLPGGGARKKLWRAAMLFAVVTLIGLWVLLGFTTGTWWPPSDWGENAVRNAALVAAAIIAAPGAYIVYRRQITQDLQVQLDKARLELERDRETTRIDEATSQTHRQELADLHARFVTAAGMLGNDKAAVRIAGVTAMATLADDWIHQPEIGDEQAQACIDVLCDYLRQPFPATLGDDQGSGGGDAEEINVRSTIMRVIRAHVLEGARVPWSKFNFDFARVEYRDSVRLDQAIFAGRVTFLEAVFNGRLTSFRGARFTGPHVSFHAARFFGGPTYFNRAEFRGATVSFRNAFFSEGALFSAARFDDAEVHFGNAMFRSTANFYRVEFTRGASFNQAKFEAAADFKGAAFTGGATDFTRAKFGGRLTLDGALLTGNVAFGRSEILSDAILDSLPPRAGDRPLSITLNDVEISEGVSVRVSGRLQERRCTTRDGIPFTGHPPAPELDTAPTSSH